MSSSTSRYVDLATLGEPASQARFHVHVHGPDRERFLQGLLSADVSALRPGCAIPATLLTVKGKIISEAVVLRDPDGLALALPVAVAAVVCDDLERHIIMDDVSLERVPEAGFTLVWGEAPVIPEGAELRAYQTTYPLPGVLLVGDAAAREAAVVGLTAASPADFTAQRVIGATPAWGHEITPGFFPPEVGFVAAVSYEKGCFRGQEPLARIHARGQVNRVMVRVEAAALPAGDEAAVPLAAPSRPEAGRWTTWVLGAGGGVLGLAIVHRSVATPGVTLTTPEGLAVTVTSGPLGDDPGLSGRSGGRSATVSLGGR